MAYLVRTKDGSYVNLDNAFRIQSENRGYKIFWSFSNADWVMVPKEDTESTKRVEDYIQVNRKRPAT